MLRRSPSGGTSSAAIRSAPSWSVTGPVKGAKEPSMISALTSSISVRTSSGTASETSARLTSPSSMSP
jgi:hypothetical protein